MTIIAINILNVSTFSNFSCLTASSSHSNRSGELPSEPTKHLTVVEGKQPAGFKVLLGKQRSFSFPIPMQVTFSDMRTMNDYFPLKVFTKKKREMMIPFCQCCCGDQTRQGTQMLSLRMWQTLHKETKKASWGQSPC